VRKNSASPTTAAVAAAGMETFPAEKLDAVCSFFVGEAMAMTMVLSK